MPAGYYKNGMKMRPPSRKGIKDTSETRLKKSLRLKKEWGDGRRTVPVKFTHNKPHSKESKIKMSESNKGKRYSILTEFKKSDIRISGENNPNWKGGISFNFIKKNAPRPKPEQCEVCGTFGKDFKKGLCYDHCHKTGKFRGWLCTRCNTALGLVKENSETLLALVEYIKLNK